jgi:hypothetical protein
MSIDDSAFLNVESEPESKEEFHSANQEQEDTASDW